METPKKQPCRKKEYEQNGILANLIEIINEQVKTNLILGKGINKKSMNLMRKLNNCH